MASRGVRRGRGGASKLGITTTTIQVDVAHHHQSQPQTIRKARPCRITIGVDVSGSMRHLIDAVISGIKKINGLLEGGDLISIVDFAENISTIFPYLSPTRVNWPDLNRTLRSHVSRSNRGCLTALWDAIGHIIDTTPRNTSLLHYKPELVIFTDGHDNASRKYTSETIQPLLRKTGIGHVHITIIDASPRGNQTLRDICEPIEHCTFTKVEASQEAIQRAFMDVVSAISKRLTINIQTNNANHQVRDVGADLVSQLTQLALGVPTITGASPALQARLRGSAARRGERARGATSSSGSSGAANWRASSTSTSSSSAAVNISGAIPQIPTAQGPVDTRGRGGRNRNRGRRQSTSTEN